MNVETKMKEVISLAMNHIQLLTKELIKLDINSENMLSKSQADRDKAWMLNNVLFHINDIIHPVHELAKDLFPDAKDFIEMCMLNQKLAIEKELLPKECNCSSCFKRE